MRVVVIGAGLGGLGVALRLQGEGHEVVVVEGRERPGGRAYQLRDEGFTWDTGPSLITMPWVLRETFAAGGLDLDQELALRPLDPYYKIRWAGEERELDFLPASRMPDELARFSSRDAKAFPGFLAALRPIYEEGILGAGRRPFLRLRDLVAFTPRMLRLGAALPLWRMVCRHFEHPRVREAFSKASASSALTRRIRSSSLSSGASYTTSTDVTTRPTRRPTPRGRVTTVRDGRGAAAWPRP